MIFVLNLVKRSFSNFLSFTFCLIAWPVFYTAAGSWLGKFVGYLYWLYYSTDGSMIGLDNHWN